MSSKHRHGLPKKRPAPAAKDDIAADDLPILEPIEDELPTLEAVDEVEVDDGPVSVTASELEPGFHLTLTVDVPAMDKGAVAEAVVAPLQRALRANPVRHQRVLVRFAGDAIVGSAVKTEVAKLLQPLKPLLAIVRRGYGDEAVCEGRLPTVDVATRTEAGVVHVEVDTGATDAEDLTMALTRHLPAIASRARGQRFVFVFRGVQPADGTRTQLAAVLQEAGAVRATVGDVVLFDNELADRIQVEVAGSAATIRIDPAADDEVTLSALAIVLPPHSATFAGKQVTLQGGKPLSAAVVSACVDACRRADAERVAMDAEVIWPPVLECVRGSAITLRVRSSGRDRAALLAAFRREAPSHVQATEKQEVVIDWPAGFTVDGEIETLCRDELGALLRPKALACTIAGERREPMLPDPAALAVDGDRFTLRLDTEAGKPVELQRAVDRRLASLAGRLRGKSARVQIVGAGAVSRTLLRSVCGAIEAAGAMRLEVEDHGVVDVLLPPLLSITRTGDEVHIAAVTAGRDDKQQVQAMQRELDAAALPAGATVVVASSTAATAIAAAVVARGAANVLLDGSEPLRVHPPLFGAPEKTGLSRRLPVRPSADAAMMARQVERELPAVLAGIGPMMTSTIHVDWPGADPASPTVLRVVQGLVAKKAAKVLLETGTASVQMHPPVRGATPIAPVAVPPPAAAEAAVAAVVAPEPAVATGPRIVVLGQKDAAEPPLTLLGVAAGTAEDHLQAVEAELREQLPRLAGRCVLLVLRNGAADWPVRREDALVTLLRRLLLGTAAATLVFRGGDAQGRPFFQVADSKVANLAVGSAVADPRPRR
jgi:hypothetical protein